MRKQMPRIVAILLALVLGQAVQAADPVRTTLTLKDLDCPSCAKKLAGKLLLVPGVADVKTDLTAKTAVITPRPQQQPSPRVLWDTTENAGFEPVKLQGPFGTFTDRPKS